MPSGLTTVLAIFASIVGIYGAILSSINAYWHWKEQHSQIRIRLYAIIEKMLDETYRYVAWQAQNIGTKPVIIAGGGIILPNRYRFWVNNVAFTNGVAFPETGGVVA